MTTVSAKAHEVPRDWFVIDAKDQILGRLASEVATRLRGKHKPIYTQHVDTGDFIVIINAEKIAVTGDKRQQKTYYRHSGRPGNLHETNLQDMLSTKPERVIELAVRGMLPKNRLGRAMIKKLKVYSGTEHPHAAQQPQNLTIKRPS